MCKLVFIQLNPFPDTLVLNYLAQLSVGNVSDSVA